MSKKTILLMFCLACSSMMQAQTRYTDYLQRKEAGKGVVVLHQDSELDDLVNGPSSAERQHATDMEEVDATENEVPVSTSRRFTTASGFRIQLISLGSTAKDKAEAEAWGRRFKTYFPGVNVYISFRSPHYVCRVGDFRTREEASQFLRELRDTRRFGSASIVKSNIHLYY